MTYGIDVYCASIEDCVTVAYVPCLSWMCLLSLCACFLLTRIKTYSFEMPHLEPRCFHTTCYVVPLSLVHMHVFTGGLKGRVCQRFTQLLPDFDPGCFQNCRLYSSQWMYLFFNLWLRRPILYSYQHVGEMFLALLQFVILLCSHTLLYSCVTLVPVCDPTVMRVCVLRYMLMVSLPMWVHVQT